MTAPGANPQDTCDHHYVAHGVNHSVVAWVRICGFCGHIELCDRTDRGGEVASIEQKDLWVGDRAAYIVRSEGVIREVDNGRVMSFQPDGFTSVTTWELIERPEAKLGSVWVDPDTGERFVALSAGCFANEGATWIVRPGAATVDRLVPAEEQA